MGRLVMFVLYAWIIFYTGFFFFQAEDGIRDLVRSRGLGDVYKRQVVDLAQCRPHLVAQRAGHDHQVALARAGAEEHALSLIHI